MWKSLEPWAVRLPNSKQKAPIEHSGGNLKDNTQINLGKEGLAHEISKEREDSTRGFGLQFVQVVCQQNTWLHSAHILRTRVAFRLWPQLSLLPTQDHSEREQQAQRKDEKIHNLARKRVCLQSYRHSSFESSCLVEELRPH